MALTATNKGLGGNNTGATSFTGVIPSVDLTVGTLGVLMISTDNAGSGGATAVCPTSFTDSKGNTWTRRVSGIFDNGAASAGVELGIYTSLIATALLTTDNANFAWAAGVSVTAKNWAFVECASNAGTPVFVTGGVNTGSTTASPTVTTSSITSGNVVIAMGAAESGDTWAADADTSNGSWTTFRHRASGTGTSGMSTVTQNKVVTGTGTQTYNPTLTSADVILGWIEIGELPVVTGTGAISVPSATVAGTGAESFTATGAVSGSAATVAGTGVETFTATGAVAVPSATAAGTGTHTPPAPSGTGAISVSSATVAGTGSLILTATGAMAASAPIVVGTGLEILTGTGAVVTSSPTVSGTGVETITGTGALAIPAATVSGSGSHTVAGAIDGSAAILAPAPTVDGTGVLVVNVTGTGAIAAPAATVEGLGTVPVPAGTGGGGGKRGRPIRPIVIRPSPAPDEAEEAFVLLL